jgi:hypothetical protein
MFDQVCESLRQVTEANARMQQDVFTKWVGMWGAPPTFPSAWGEQVQQIQKKWGEFITEAIKRHRETIETQFRAGMENIEMAFKVGEAKNVEDMRAMTIELWQKCFNSIRQISEAQVRDYQVMMEKWVELVTKPKG